MNHKKDLQENKDQAAGRKLVFSPWLIIAGILVLTGFLYRASLKGEFLSYDDTDNIVNNPVIRHLSFESLPGFFKTSALYMYTPATFISYAVDYKIYGLDPYYFKLTNLILHLVNILLLWLLSLQILKKRNPAILCTLLFAVHPMNVDSVSWISGRSNLLSVLFFLITILFYLKYVQKARSYLLILSSFSFVLSLLSKSSGVMLPFSLLLIDFLYKRKFSHRMILEKVPFFIISLLAGVLTIWFRSDTGNVQNIPLYTLTDRLFMICYSLSAYLIRSIVPFPLSEVYAYPVKSGGLLPLLYYVSPVVIIGIVAVINRISAMKREIIFGLSFFLVNVILTQVILLEDGFMANRYTYLPYLGIFFILAIVYDHFTSQSLRLKRYISGLAVLMILLLSWSTWQRSLVWANTIGLFDHTISRSPGCAFAYNNRGIAKYANDPESALEDYNKAITINPGYAGAYYNRGIAYYAVRDYEKAWDDYTKAIVLDPVFASSYAARGIIEMDVLKNNTLALQDYTKAITLNPAFGMAYYNRGIVYLRMNEVSLACRDFRKVHDLGYVQADEFISRYCR